jgi:hypothetical protein
MLANARWRTISWRTGTKGKLKARFAAVRVRVADGPSQRIRDKGQQHLPGDESWLIGEHRNSGEKKYYLANLPADTDLHTLAASIKARWICEQAHQQLKEELGLDHFEGRSWLHRHALMTMIAYAFLQYRRLKTARRKKKKQRASTATDFARRTPRHPRTHRSTTAAAMPTLPKMDRLGWHRPASDTRMPDCGRHPHRRSSRHHDDEIRVVSCLSADAVVGYDERRARRQLFGDSLDHIRRYFDAIESGVGLVGRRRRWGRLHNLVAWRAPLGGMGRARKFLRHRDHGPANCTLGLAPHRGEHVCACG